MVRDIRAPTIYIQFSILYFPSVRSLKDSLYISLYKYSFLFLRCACKILSFCFVPGKIVKKIVLQCIST